MIPQEFLVRMEAMLKEEYPAFLAQYERERARALRVNTLKTDPKRFADTALFALRPVPWAAAGYYYDGGDLPGQHPYHEAGVYYIQEPSAMAPAEYLMQEPSGQELSGSLTQEPSGQEPSESLMQEPAEGTPRAADAERILDLCAAPGGKSTQIAAAMKGRGILVCNEIHPARAKILSENTERMGIRNAVVTNETPKRLAEHFGAYFTRILVDAPCSGEGMFRKNETACEEWSAGHVAMCAARQDEILDEAAVMLKPGGRLVYSTCTFAPEENEGSVRRFLLRHPDFFVEPAARREGMAEGVPAWGGEGEQGAELAKTIRLWPHRLNGEGHYLAVLRKKGVISDGAGRDARCGRQPGMSRKEAERPGGALDAYRAFSEADLTGVCAVRTVLPERCLLFGGQFYLMPEGMPRIAGLKVLRPGFHLGTVKKNRFEPSHALALALNPKEARSVADLSPDDKRVRAYLAGETFPWDGPKGWTLVAVDGYSLGWGKVSGGILKNHYPKGLRIFL
ncbi:MAG: RNA methyltransferase [Roseburia sp.]|jgi:16S rRNA C967 or C1407 C5-methylase (RsmB/RsmF family)/NOL1/NOP2/fmu family ribosome biogenesis protein|nr:RNA methyltransferase [Roseburia sp.]